MLQLKTVRSSLGLTQAELAQRLGITVNYVSLLERGVRQPSKSLEEKISSLMRENVIEKERVLTKEELREWRKRLGLTLKDLARLTEYGFNYISQIELGNRQINARFSDSMRNALRAYEQNGEGSSLLEAQGIPEAFDIKDIRKELGISQEELAELIGVTRTYVSLLENGARNPSPSLMWKIESLLSEKDKQKEITKETHTIPVVGMAAAASFDPSLSNLCDLWECSDERMACVCKHAEQLFGVRISGDSMAPTLLEGDVVAVSDTLPATGDICIVRHRTEGVLCKKWYWRNGVIRLDSINPEGKSFEWTKETFSAENPIVWRFRVEALIYRKLG